MGSQTSAVLVLFLVLVGAATLFAGRPYPWPISPDEHEKAQFLGKFAVDQYNKRKNGESHLYFIEVVNGTIRDFLFPGQYVWNLELKAVNCSEAGAKALYSVDIYQDLDISFVPVEMHAYGSNWASGDLYKIENI